MRPIVPAILLLCIPPFQAGLSDNERSGSETILFERLPTEAIGSPTVLTIIRDSVGYMWFGTSGGLCRFDGHETRVYHPVPGNSPANFVRALIADRLSRLWVGTGNGVFVFDTRKEVFIPIEADSGSMRMLTGAKVMSMIKDHGGILWIATVDAGLIRLDPATLQARTISHHPVDNDAANTHDIRALFEDHTGTLWIGTMDAGICTLDTKSGTVRPFVHAGKSRTCMSIREDKKGRIYFAMTDGLGIIDSARQRVRYHRRATLQWIASLEPDASGNIWIGAATLVRFDPNAGTFTDYPSTQGNPNSVNGRSVLSIFFDTTGNATGSPGSLWVGTRNGGVTKVVIRPKQFQTVEHDPSDSLSLGHGAVHALFEDANRILWSGSWGGGIARIDRRTRSIRKYTHAAGNPHSIPNDDVRSFLLDDSGRLWAGTTMGLSFFVEDGDVWKRYSLEGISDSHAVSSLCQDSRGGIWVGTFDAGVFVIDNVRERRIRHYAADSSNDHSLSDDAVGSIVEDRDGVVWIGTVSGGLNRFTPATSVFDRWVHDPGVATSLSDMNASKVFVDSRGTLWVGTFDGLNRFDPATQTFVRYRNPDWNLQWYITGITEDSHGSLWISSNAGLIRFNPSLGLIKTFGSADGLEVIPPFSSCTKNSRGEILLGGEGSITIFPPDSLTEPLVPSPVVISEMTVSGEHMSVPDHDIVLPHDLNDLSFSFAVLDYVQPARNRYAYMLVGLDQDWIYSGTRHYARYSALPHGEYLLRVKGANSAGLWNDPGTSLNITVTPPYWKTWWFILVTAIALLGITAMLYRYRVSRLLEVERMRIRIASDLHDELGGNLSAIGIASRMVLDNATLNETERKRLRTIEEQADRTAGAMREIVWFINPSNDSMEDLILKMKDAAPAILGEIPVNFIHDGKSETEALSIEFRRNIFLSFKEILNNIHQHASASRVNVSIAQARGEFTLAVSDNGVGFPVEERRAGNGLKNLVARATKLRGAVNIQSEPGKGTVVTITVKMT